MKKKCEKQNKNTQWNKKISIDEIHQKCMFQLCIETNALACFSRANVLLIEKVIDIANKKLKILQYYYVWNVGCGNKWRTRHQLYYQ